MPDERYTKEAIRTRIVGKMARQTEMSSLGNIGLNKGNGGLEGALKVLQRTNQLRKPTSEMFYGN